MKKPLFLSAALVLSAAGCTLLEPRPTPSGAQCSTLGPAPTPPPAQTIPPTGAVPTLPGSQFIVVGSCESTGAYLATGVDVQGGRFTFLLKGTAESRTTAFRSFYAAGVPVTVYSGRVKLKAGIFDPCAATADDSNISDDPREPPVPPGISDDPREPPVPPGIASLAWCTANAQTVVTQ